MSFFEKLFGKKQEDPEPQESPVENNKVPPLEKIASPEPIPSSVEKGRETWKKNLETDHPKIVNELLLQRGSSAPTEFSMALECEKDGDPMGARLHYMKAVESITQFNTLSDNSIAKEVEAYKKAYCDFAVKRDPLFKSYLAALLPIVTNTPGILQTELYIKTTLDKSDISYCLYFAAEAGIIKREKKGRTYQLTVSGK